MPGSGSIQSPDKEKGRQRGTRGPCSSSAPSGTILRWWLLTCSPSAGPRPPSPRASFSPSPARFSSLFQEVGFASLYCSRSNLPPLLLLLLLSAWVSPPPSSLLLPLPSLSLAVCVARCVARSLAPSLSLSTKFNSLTFIGMFSSNYVIFLVFCHNDNQITFKCNQVTESK